MTCPDIASAYWWHGTGWSVGVAALAVVLMVWLAWRRDQRKAYK